MDVEKSAGQPAPILKAGADSKSAEGNLMRVRFPLPAPSKSTTYDASATADFRIVPQRVPQRGRDD